jgi:hypothetical protein
MGVDVVGRSTFREARLAFAVLTVVAAMVLSGCAIGFRGPALGVTYNIARLTGDVQSNRTELGAYWFRYGKTASYGQETPHQGISFTANVRQNVTELIEALEPATTYHYSLCAEDQDPAVDALCSGDETFTTTGDYVRGSVLAVSPLGLGIFTFNDVRSGPAGENPVGSVATSGGVGSISGPVSCLRVTGDTRVTVGADSLFVFFDLPVGALGTISAESLDGRDPGVCPLDPTGGGSAQAARNSDFTMHDDP